MNLRILGNLPNPPTFSHLPLPWRAESELSPMPDPSPLPPLPPSSPHPDRRRALFEIRDAIVRAVRSLVVDRGRNSSSVVPLARPAKLRRSDGADSSGCALQLFRPYVAKVPWHGGVRAFLSQLFPRYGHYCGPNWSSGKDGGLPLWDRRPMDWLDFCCYCHDIGYDTHDQTKLLQADLAFLECLERPRMATKGDARVAYLYKTMCIAGLRNFLIPYRLQLVRMQTGPSFIQVMNNLVSKSMSCSQRLDKGS